MLTNYDIFQFIPPADIALYAVLTGLATFNRVELKKKILENADLRPMLDLEPYLRDIVRAFYDSKFKEGLRALTKYVVSSFVYSSPRAGVQWKSDDLNTFLISRLDLISIFICHLITQLL